MIRGIDIASIDMKTIGWVVTGCYLILGFFTPFGFEAVGLVCYSVLMALVALVHIAGMDKWDNQTIVIFAVLGMLSIAFLLSCAVSPFSHTTGMRIILFLFDAVVLVGLLKVQECGFNGIRFYRLTTILIVATLTMYLYSPIYFSNFAGVNKPLHDLAPLLYGATDKNRTALVVFIYFGYSIKHKKKLGIGIGLVYPAFYFGRLYIVMAIVMVSTLIVSRMLKKPSIFSSILSTKYIFLFFLGSVVLITLFSSFWTNVIMARGVQDYKTSWNDSSNALRMTSINYIAENILNNPSYILYGLDSNIFEELGISQTETTKGSTFYVDGLYRLVQPHQEVLNTLLKEGALLTLCIYGLVSLILSSLQTDLYNRSIILAFLTGSLFLHEMFLVQTFLLLVYVLCTKQGNATSLNRSRVSAPWSIPTLPHTLSR